ncbi:MAG: glycosyl-4,4-diaponeurosporenoate acyltransferase [Clostridiales bacterium]|jgi:glycosyl-4,4'-diaponeurosporenoate acyltransferase|nr:glycosyl-4,4-diaponeurosporenoate acyltransferase [Clostridiales bacterium]
MRVVELSIFWTIIIDFIAWFIIHMAAALLALKLPDRYFKSDNWLYKSHNWEKSGQFWQDKFKVRVWKEKLPDGAAILGQGFAKKRLQAAEAAYFEQFILESRRAEFTHYLAMLPAVLFFLWNPPWAGVFIIFYAIAANIPCVIAQRYNRPRFVRAASRLRNSSSSTASPQPASGWKK